MDYTSKGQTVYEPKDFFTPGVGDIPVNQNTFEAENNLDLTNNQTSWNQGETYQNARNLGNTAISTQDALGHKEQDYLQPHSHFLYFYLLLVELLSFFLQPELLLIYFLLG